MLIDKARESVEAEKAALDAEYQELESVYAVAGKAWAIPRLISTKQPEPEPIPERQVIGTSGEFIEVDDFPESHPRLTKEEISEKVRRKYPDEVLKDASEFVGLLLAEESKHIFNLEDLGEILYGEDEENRRVRISALISNYERGKLNIIGGVLEGHGLVFQRGERRSYHKDSGQPFGSRYAVFRAVPVEQADRKERVVHSDEQVDWVNDGWHTVVFDPTPTRPDPSDETVSEIIAAENVRVDEVATEAAAVAEPPESEQLYSANGAGVMPSRNILSKLPSREAKKKKEPEWKVSFRDDISEAITHFETDGLMVEGEVSRTVIRVKSSSRAMGTETMADRAVSNGIISRREVDSDLPIYKYIYALC